MDYIIPAFSMLALDSIYLSNIGGPLFAKMVNGIQKEDMKLNIFGAIGSYILLILVLYKFIILERKPLSDAFLLGFCIYGIFDLTNIAIFKNYQIIPAILDTVWGGVLFYTVTWITYKLLRIKY
tara:strand:+ start:8056 stop:8427 length:372 start_codon:yes stop_codon:yes gene_type:complete